MNKYISTTILLFLSLGLNAQVTFKWGIDNQLHHQLRIANEFKNIIEKKSSGAVKIEVIPYDIKDSRDSATSSIEKKVYDIAQTFVGNYIAQAPELEVFQIPYLFKTTKQIEKFLQSPKANTILKKLNTPHALAINFSYAGGFLSYHSEQKIDSFSQLKGKECYNVKSYGFVKNFLKPSGIKSTNNVDSKDYSCGEVLSSELDSIYSFENAHKRWINITNHRVITRVTFLSQEKLKKLSPKIQSYFKVELSDALKRERFYVYDAMTIVTKLLKNRGFRINVWSPKQISNYLETIKKPLAKMRARNKETYDFIKSLQ